MGWLDNVLKCHTTFGMGSNTTIIGHTLCNRGAPVVTVLAGLVAAAIASAHLGLSAYLYLFAESERALLPASQWSSTGYAAPDATMVAAAVSLAVAVLALLWRQASVGVYDPAE